VASMAVVGEVFRSRKLSESEFPNRPPPHSGGLETAAPWVSGPSPLKYKEGRFEIALFVVSAV